VIGAQETGYAAISKTKLITPLIIAGGGLDILA
jgi:hypothetical protein